MEKKNREVSVMERSIELWAGYLSASGLGSTASTEAQSPLLDLSSRIIRFESVLPSASVRLFIDSGLRLQSPLHFYFNLSQKEKQFQ
jgi:hypothetical protein